MRPAVQFLILLFSFRYEYSAAQATFQPNLCLYKQSIMTELTNLVQLRTVVKLAVYWLNAIFRQSCFAPLTGLFIYFFTRHYTAFIWNNLLGHWFWDSNFSFHSAIRWRKHDIFFEPLFFFNCKDTQEIDPKSSISFFVQAVFNEETFYLAKYDIFIEERYLEILPQ